MSDVEQASKEQLEAEKLSGSQRLESDNSSLISVLRERKLTWKEATLLLLTEYVVLAILAFPSSFRVLGMAGGTIATLLIGVLTYYTSHVLWRYCMKHPEIRDICDAAYALTGTRWAWWLAFVGLAANNWAIMGLHVVAGATAVQTIRGGVECTLVWAVAMGVIMWFFSNLRDFKHMAYIGVLASSTMFICVWIVIIGHGIQGHPNGWVEGDVIKITTWAPEGTTFVQGMNALLNIVYTWIGHALIPSFVGDLEHPEDFPKALAISMCFEFILFSVTGIVVYRYAGQFSTAPGYGSLLSSLSRVAAGFTLPTILIVGILYSLVTSRAIFFQIFPEGSIHRTRHTFKGWGVWVFIVFGGWVISFVIGEAIPFFSDLLATIASVFDSWFGYIMWSAAYFEIYRDTPSESRGLLIALTGAFFFIGGTYVSIQSIINSYHEGAIKAPFQCTNTGFTF
ncbi:transmembrane amino acid transporter protein-domain-containing protein [Leucosporidium creatinivorum]|uniref:Transmembrane amino acid transporter protein-domain-containing protein n=1 Tax=Leucosporidium creatinivorum TaxID=106004 RepID=A0A1Y2G4V8_9BASI|nr:transmembrane amino acid transporter protein-domain-containing protein [Leucosporidium creatinivorum]